LSFPDAVEELAARFGVRLQYETGSRRSDNAPDREKFYRINELAHGYFQELFAKAPARIIEYLAKRGITKQARETFGLGFASAERLSLFPYLRSKGVPEELIIQAGLVRRSERGELYDTFRARIIFPIFIERNKIAGFGGRIVPELLNPE